jgi:signal transduction histidine kinase
MPLRFPRTISALFSIWTASALAQADSFSPENAQPLVIDHVAINGIYATWPTGGILRTKASPKTIRPTFGPAPNSGWQPIRLRYKLEGWERDWRSGDGEMSLTVCFGNEAGDKIAQREFHVRGDSAGWNGTLRNSPLTYRRETLVAPPEASRLWVVISSAGGPAVIGIYIVENLVVYRLSADGVPAELALRLPFNRNAGNAPRQETFPGGEELGDWERDGIKPSMAKVFEMGEDPKVKALGILDEDPHGHAEWHNHRESAPRIAPGERLVMEWNELYSIGLADLWNVSPAYDNLPPGDYQFRVQEVTALGTPTGVFASLRIKVPLALWKREWFWIAAGIVAVASVAAGSRWYEWHKMRHVVARLENETLMERERLRIARNIHDDLGARVTQISLFSAMAKSKRALPVEAQADFERISFMSRELVSSLYETIWAVDPENDNLEALGDYLCETASQLCETAQLRCRLEMMDLSREIEISSQTRHSIGMAAKEAVNNAIKHARASEVAVRVEYMEPLLAISISDDGCGFLSAEGGHGLTNMKRRLEDLGGTCLIESRPMQGTKIQFHVAVPSPGTKKRKKLPRTFPTENL